MCVRETYIGDAQQTRFQNNLTRVGGMLNSTQLILSRFKIVNKKRRVACDVFNELNVWLIDAICCSRLKRYCLRFLLLHFVLKQ